MTGLIGVLIGYGALTLLINGTIFIESLGNDLGPVLDEALNPFTIYKSNKVNIFGCIVLTIFGHLLLPWLAPFYWFYKLCTVGRK